MMREARGHTKMKRLCRKMDIPLWQAMGILEALWHLTATEAFRGDIGRLSDEEIALGMDYRGDEKHLIECLVSCDWLDRDDTHRLLVHDWHEHADNAVKKKVKRATDRGDDGFYGATVRKISVLAHKSGQNDETAGHVQPKEPNGGLPEPVPVPEPDPVPGAVPRSTPRAAVTPFPVRSNLGITSEDLEAAWEKHKNYSPKEPYDVAVRLLIGKEVDWGKFKVRHGPWCEYWAKKGWNSFGSLTLYGWISANMPLPPDEAQQSRTSAITSPGGGSAVGGKEPFEQQQIRIMTERVSRGEHPFVGYTLEGDK